MANQIRKFVKNETIFLEGDLPFSIFIVKQGTVSIRKRKNQSYVEVGKLFEGEVLGEMALFDRKPRSATAVSVSDVELIEIPLDGLDKIYQPLPDYLKAIIASMAERLRKANATIRQLQETQTAGVADSQSGIDSDDALDQLLYNSDGDDQNPSKK